MSKVSKGSLADKEEMLKREIHAATDYEYNHQFVKNLKLKSKGHVAALVAREITNGKDKYEVSDALYSYSAIRGGGSWQYGSRIDTVKGKVRCFTVFNDGQTMKLEIKKETGTYQEYGDSNASGNIEEFYSVMMRNNEDRYTGNQLTIPKDIDLSDTNAIRFALRDNEKAAYFLDKFVIVTEEERASYKAYEKEQVERINAEKKHLETETKLKEKEKEKKARRIQDKKEANEVRRAAAKEISKQKKFAEKMLGK